MYKRKKEELEFVTNKRSNEVVKRVIEALERNKPLSAKDFFRSERIV